MPLHIHTAPRRAGLTRVAIIAGAVGIIAGGTAVALGDEQTIAEPSPPAATRYFDVESNKARSMRVLGLHMSRRTLSPIPNYEDIEANKARSGRAR